MRIKDDFVLREVADMWVVLPIGETTRSLDGMISLNESGAFLWRCLETDCTQEQLARKLTEEYAIDYSQALEDVVEYIQMLTRIGCIEG